MSNTIQTVQYDYDSYDIITTAIMSMLNEYPGLSSGQTIDFSVLSENKGVAMFPGAGAVIESSTKDILGNTHQICQYPFMVFYRAGKLSESRKVSVKEWLDDLGRWLEGQVITVGSTDYQLTTYPTLSGNRRFKTIRRNSPAYLNNVNDNNTEDWAISIVARYENNF